MSKLWLEKKNFYLGEEGDQGVPFQKKVFPMYSNQLMDSRNVNFSIKKSQIHTHMLGLPQKLTKLEIALKTSIALDLGLVPKNWPWNKLLFTLFTAKAPPGGHWWNRGLGPKFTNEVLTYLIKKNLIKITLRSPPLSSKKVHSFRLINSQFLYKIAYIYSWNIFAI